MQKNSNEFNTRGINVKEFVHKKYGEGWIEEWSVSSIEGQVRSFVDKEGIQYKILYKKNQHSVYVPYQILEVKI